MSALKIDGDTIRYLKRRGWKPVTIVNQCWRDPESPAHFCYEIAEAREIQIERDKETNRE